MAKKLKRRDAGRTKPARGVPVRQVIDLRLTTDDTFDSFALPAEPESELLTDGIRSCFVYPELFPDTAEKLRADGFHALGPREALSFLINSPVVQRPELDDEEFLAVLADPDVPGILGDHFQPALVDRRRSALHSVGVGLGAHFVRAPRSAPEALVTTSTGETLKPVRLLYAVREVHPTAVHLARLPWVELDPDKKRLVWLNNRLPAEVPIAAHPPSTVLASMYFGADWMWVQTNASARALAFIDLFAGALEGRARLLYGLDIDRTFTAGEWASVDVDGLFGHARVLTPGYLADADADTMDFVATARRNRALAVGRGKVS